jgi:hypothetical protein
MGQVHQCWWRIRQEINVFSRFEYDMFYVLYPFVAYLLTLPCTYEKKLYSHVKVAIYTYCSRKCLAIGSTDSRLSQLFSDDVDPVLG